MGPALLSLWLLLGAANEAAISYVPIAKKRATGLDRFMCKGSLGVPNALGEIGYSDRALARGVTCRKADFDGDGEADYLFYKCGEGLIECRLKAALMAKPNVVKRLIVLENTFEVPEVYYAKQPTSEAHRV